MKKYKQPQPRGEASSYQEYEKQIAIEKQYRAYLGYCVKEGCLDPEEAKDLVDKKDWERVEYMMDYGDYLADSAKDERR